jgi:WD40 repeat protein
MDTTGAEQRIRVFLSVAPRDHEAVVWLRPRLLADGIEILGDADATLSDAERRRARDAAIAEADIVFFVLSPFGVIFEECLADIAQARALAKRIIPLIVSEADWSKVPAGLVASQAVMLKDTAKREAALRDLLARLAEDVARVQLHARLGARARDWDARGRPNMMTLTDDEIPAAEQWLIEQPENLPQPEPLLRAFVLANLKVTKQRLWTTAKLSLGAAALAFLVTGGALWLRGVAKENERIALERDRSVREQEVRVTRLEKQVTATLAEAEKRRDDAEAARLRGQLTQARAMHWLAQHLQRTGEATRATLVAIESLDLARAGGDAALVGEAEGTLRASLADLRERRVFESGTQALFSPDSAALALVTRDRVEIVDAKSGATLRRLEHAGVRALAFSPDGEMIVSAGDDQVMRIWNARSGAPAGASEKHPRPIHDLHVSRDGARVLTGAADGRIRVFDLRKATLLFTLGDGDETMRAAGFTADGRQVITAHANGTLRIWDPGNRRPAEIRDLGGIDLVSLSPDGRHLLVAGAETVLFDLRVRRRVATLRGADRISAAAFTADGKRIVTAARDGMVRFWDTLSGDALGSLRGHDAVVQGLAFSADGLTLASASEGQVRLWGVNLDSRRAETAPRAAPLAGDALLTAARAAVPRCLTVAQRAQLLSDPSPPDWCITLEKPPYRTNEWQVWRNARSTGQTPPLPASR